MTNLTCQECKSANIKTSKRIIDDEKEETQRYCNECGLVIKEKWTHLGCGGEIKEGRNKTTSWMDCQKCKKHWEGFLDIDRGPNPYLH